MKNMPKIRTNRGASKRFKLTGNKKIKRNKAYRSHILTKKTSKRKRNLRKSGLIDSTEEKRVKRMLSV
jgi:large subunit ribosomal protein L35